MNVLKPLETAVNGCIYFGWFLVMCYSVTPVVHQTTIYKSNNCLRTFYLLEHYLYASFDEIK